MDETKFTPLPWTRARQALSVALNGQHPVILMSHHVPVAILLRLPLSFEIARRGKTEWTQELILQATEAIQEALA